MKTPSGGGQTVSVNGMQMYYELRSQGEPLVLLHGFTGTGVDWELIFCGEGHGSQALALPGRTSQPAR